MSLAACENSTEHLLDDQISHLANLTEAAATLESRLRNVTDRIMGVEPQANETGQIGQSPNTMHDDPVMLQRLSRANDTLAGRKAAKTKAAKVYNANRGNRKPVTGKHKEGDRNG